MTRRLSMFALGSLAALGLLAACSGGGGGGGGSDTCTPNGTNLTITATNIQFDTSCLAVPANQSFTVVFHNDDPNVEHTFSIYTDSSAKKGLFKGPFFSGVKTQTYNIKALPAGTYYFQCDVHPAMNGTFIVQSPGSGAPPTSP